MPGCHEHSQSALHPQGPAARSIFTLWWFMFFLLTAVFMATMLLLLIAILVRAKETRPGPPLGASAFVITTGLAIPTVILFMLMFFSSGATIALRTPRETDLTIRIVGNRFWWDVIYPHHNIKTANEIYIPANTPILLELTSADVIHSFWVPNLAGKMDLIPDATNLFWLQADPPALPATYRGQCAEYCGVQHALMAFTVHILSPEDFQQWLADRQRPHPEPATEHLRRGRDAFFNPNAGCYTCHAIRGTPPPHASGDLGPDLTHIGARPTLAAATIPNTRENLAKWILAPQSVKPGNRMPPTVIADDDLEAMIDYLMSLK